MTRLAPLLLLTAATAWAAFWGGPIATGLPPGYRPSIAQYGSSAYLYYTALGQNGLVASGVILQGPAYAQALPLPAPSSSPRLCQLPNGSLAALWASGGSLYMSLLGGGGWGAPVELMSGGYLLDYWCSWPFIYAAWEPYFDPTYGASELVVLGPNGTRAAVRAPGLVALNGAEGRLAVGVFANGTYALIYLNGTVRRLEAQYAGLADGELYALSGGVLRFGGSALGVPWASGASIAPNCGRALVVAWGGGRLAVYAVNGTSALPLRDLYVPGVREASGVCAGGYLYVAAESLANYSESIWAFVVPLTPDKPTLDLYLNGSTARVVWDIPYPQEYNVSSIYLKVYLNGSLIDKRDVPAQGALNYTLSLPGNYSFVVEARNPFGAAAASANATYYPPRRPAQQTTTSTQPTPTTTAQPPTSVATSAPQTTTASQATGSFSLYSIALGAATVAVALYILLGGRRRARSP